MKKSIVIAALICALAGCTSASRKPEGAETSSIGFDLPNGSLTLVVDGSGNFVSAKTSASAQVLNDTPAGHEAAVTVATSRAKRTLAEFMTDQVKSNNSIDQIAHATSEGNTYAQEVAEKISTSANSLLRGVYVSKQHLEDNTMMVEMTVTKQSIQGSRTLRTQMSGI
jgi:hypothetical protein